MKKERTVALIQARTSSSRLPRKSITPLCGKPLIFHVIDRVKQAQGIHAIVVATSTDSTDDVLADMVTKRGDLIFRGDLVNVQKRMYDAAIFYQADSIIRVTGDNPFVEPRLIEAMIQKRAESEVDYIGWKDCVLGIGTELFTRSSFEKAIALSRNAYDYEHVTPPYYQQQEHFKVCFMNAPGDLVSPHLRLTVDTRADFERIEVYYRTFQRNGIVSVSEIIQHERKKESL